MTVEDKDKPEGLLTDSLGEDEEDPSDAESDAWCPLGRQGCHLSRYGLFSRWQIVGEKAR